MPSRVLLSLSNLCKVLQKGDNENANVQTQLHCFFLLHNSVYVTDNRLAGQLLHFQD